MDENNWVTWFNNIYLRFHLLHTSYKVTDKWFHHSFINGCLSGCCPGCQTWINNLQSYQQQAIMECSILKIQLILYPLFTVSSLRADPREPAEVWAPGRADRRQVFSPQGALGRGDSLSPAWWWHTASEYEQMWGGRLDLPTSSEKFLSPSKNNSKYLLTTKRVKGALEGKMFTKSSREIWTYCLVYCWFITKLRPDEVSLGWNCITNQG